MNKDEYAKKYRDNEKITGFGIGNVQVHSPCPFCAEPDFITYLIHDVREALERGAVCKVCKRGSRGVFSDVPGGVRFELVQTEGDAPPEWAPPMRHARDLLVNVKLNGADVKLPARVSFDQVVEAAGLTGNPSITVKGAGSRGFIFSPTHTRDLSEGDIINAVHTGNA